MTDVVNASEEPAIDAVLGVGQTTTITCDANFAVSGSPTVTVTCENNGGVGQLTLPTCAGESLFSSFEIAYQAGVENNLFNTLYDFITLL